MLLITISYIVVITPPIIRAVTMPTIIIIQTIQIEDMVVATIQMMRKNHGGNSGSGIKYV